MKFFSHIAYIILLCLLPGIGQCNNASYYFKQIAIEQGLSQSSINSILCDHKGILWIGTKSGLNCYDQHELKSFFNEKDNKYSLPGNHIQFVAEDSLNNLWVSTNKGLVKYNPDYNHFDPIIKEKIFSYICTRRDSFRRRKNTLPVRLQKQKYRTYPSPYGKSPTGNRRILHSQHIKDRRK